MVFFLRTKPLGREMLNIQMREGLWGGGACGFGASSAAEAGPDGRRAGSQGEIVVLLACLLPTQQQGKSRPISGTQKDGLVGWFSNR